MSSKKNEFDFVDYMQKHNRNAALARSAKAAEEAAQAIKEQARQAKLDREANDLHRAQMKEIAKAEKEANDRHRAKLEEMAKAEKEANDRHRAEMKELARKEKEAKEFTKQQQFKLYDISCRLEELETQETVIAKIRLFNEVNVDFEKISQDTIEDLQYRKLYTKVKKTLEKEQKVISRDYSKEWMLYLKFCDLKKQAEPYNALQTLQTFDDFHRAKKLLDEIKVITGEMPELTIENSVFLQKSIERFQESVENVKWFWNNFTRNDLIESVSQLQFLLFSFYKLDGRTMRDKDWENVTPAGPSPEVFKIFCKHCLEYVQKNNDCFDTALQLMGNIDNPDAELATQVLKNKQKEYEEEEQRKREEEKERAKAEQKRKRRKMICIGASLTAVLFAVGTCCIYSEKLLWGIGFIMIGVLFAVFGVAYLVDKKENEKKDNSDQECILKH